MEFIIIIIIIFVVNLDLETKLNASFQFLENEDFKLELFTKS